MKVLYAYLINVQKDNKIQAIVTNILEQLNSDFSITSFLSDVVNLAKLLKMKIKMISSTSRWHLIVKNMSNVNFRKIEKYCDLGFVIPYVIGSLGS